MQPLLRVMLEAGVGPKGKVDITQGVWWMPRKPDNGGATSLKSRVCRNTPARFVGGWLEKGQGAILIPRWRSTLVECDEEHVGPGDQSTGTVPKI